MTERFKTCDERILNHLDLKQLLIVKKSHEKYIEGLRRSIKIVNDRVQYLHDRIKAKEKENEQHSS